jgi:hypothetical protein
MNRAGVIITCLLMSHVAAWFHLRLILVVAALLAGFALVVVFKKRRPDPFATRAPGVTATIVPIGPPSRRVAAGCASARGHRRQG